MWVFGRWEYVSGIETQRPITSPGIAWTLWGIRALGLHPFLPLQLFPPAHWSLVPSPSRTRFPLLRPGPLRPAGRPGPTHFLCRLNSAPTWGGKFLSSRWAAASPSFPAGQESPKRVGRLVGLQASSQGGEVTRPQSHNRETTPGQFGTIGSNSARGARFRTRPPLSLFQLGVSGATCWQSAGQHLSESPLSSRPRAKQSEQTSAETVFIYL